MTGWTQRYFFYTSPPLLPGGMHIAGNGISARRDVVVFFACAFLAFLLTFLARLLELPYWGSPSYSLREEYLLATHDAYHWIAGAEGFEFGAGHPMSELVRWFACLSGMDVANAGFWLPLFMGSILAVAVFFWGWALGYPYAGVCAGVLTSLSPGFFARTLLGFYDTDLVILLFAVLLGLGPAIWLTPWLASVPDLAAGFLDRRRQRLAIPQPNSLNVEEPASGPGNGQGRQLRLRHPFPLWFFGYSDRPGSLELTDDQMRRSMLDWPWLLLLIISGLFGYWMQQWHSVFPYLVRFSALLTPALIIFFGPRGGRLILLRGALCHVLPLLAGLPGLLYALAWASFIGLAPEEGFVRAKEHGKGKKLLNLFEKPLGKVPGFMQGRVALALLWLLVLFLALDNTVFTAMGRSFSAYVDRGGDMSSLPTAVDDPLIFPSVAQSIIEVQTISLSDLFVYFHLNEWVSVAGLLCFVLALFFVPSLAWFAPLVLLSFLSLRMGARMVMFGPAGLMLALCMSGAIISEQIGFRALWSLWGKSSRVARRVFAMIAFSPLVGTARVRDDMLRVSWCLLCTLFLAWPLVMLIPDYTQGPVISREQAAGLRHLKNYSPGDSVVWNWWDWGYATHHFSHRTTIADGARHGGPSLYLPAAVYTASDPRYARQIIKYTALKGNQPGEVFHGLSATEAQALMNSLADPDNLLIEAPGTQYVVVSFELMRLGLWVTRYGSWDFVKKEGAGGLMSNLTPALKYSMKDGQIQARDGQVVYADSIDVFSPAGLERGSYKNNSGYHFIFNPAPAGQPEQAEKRSDALARFWRWQRGNFTYTAITNDKLAVDEAYYNSMMVQLLLCQRSDPRISPYFKLVYDNVYTRVYEVK